MAKKRNKKYNPHQKAKLKVVGLIVSWSDTSPMMDTTGFIAGTVSHKNPIYRLAVSELYGRHKDWIVHQQEFLWQVTMTVVFNYPNGSQQREDRELTAMIKLSELEATCEEEFYDAMRHGDDTCYSHTEFVVVCLGDADRSSGAAA